jgi:PAS domain S-box-containing protein
MVDVADEARAASKAVFPGGGEMGARMRNHEWDLTPLGPVARWPQSLRTALGILLDSGYPMYIAWGPEFIQFYNDAYRPILGATKHPAALGQSTPECFAEIWDFIGPMFRQVMSDGKATTLIDQLLQLDRNGYVEECYFTFSYSTVRDESGQAGGVFVTVIETTDRVLSERRLTTLRALAEQATQLLNVEQVCLAAARTLQANPNDLPFVLLYLLDPDAKTARLVAGTGPAGTMSTNPPVIARDDKNLFWPLKQVLETGRTIVEGLAGKFGPPAGDTWQDPPQRALVLPLSQAGQKSAAGFFIAGISPHLPFDGDYSGFMELAAGHIATAIANARAYDEERKRAEALAALDRAKTAFFSDVSHEFRTPLALMLAPAEDALNDKLQPLPPGQRERVELVHRNGLRLLKLVNNLLDFSRIEAGRVEASYEPVDLAGYTSELASVFRSAIERANLKLVVGCPPLSESIYVDRDMWEKVVLNLLSNAFKFTLAGEISVTLTEVNAWVELRVRDTGVGIPEIELPNVFNRFHRVKGVGGRTNEGSGIGLALVQELVKLHGGYVAVESVADRGSTFIVTIPKGKAHLRVESVAAAHTFSTALGSSPYVEEALRWLPDSDEKWSPGDLELNSHLASGASFTARRLPGKTPLVLLADDNSDMRLYIKRLLESRYEVEVVADGIAALAAAQKRVPDLVLTDVMMPNLDGFGLLRELRAHPRTKTVPIILLSARAGEEARIEGLEAGADDYLIKPFNARELLARVSACLEISYIRTDAEKTVREKEERLRAALAASETGTFRWDFITNQLQWDENLDRLFGVQPGTTVRSLDKFIEIIHPEERQQAIERCELCRTAGTDFEMEFRVIWPDGSVHWLSDKGKTFFDSAGKPSYMTGACVDISAPKQAEVEREEMLEREQQLRAEAENANRLKDYFLATVSHELRTPLNAILGWATMLRSNKLNVETAAQAIEIIERNARSQNQLIADLLDVSRIVTGKLTLDIRPVELGPLLDAALDVVRPAADAKQITISRVFQAREIINADPDRLQQVIWNLLTNAVKFTPTCGDIEIKLESSADEVRISITDSGEGIDPKFLDYVFDRFRQQDSSTTRTHGGLGLGLSIVRHLVEMHGGTVMASSEGRGRGATFTVLLPRSPDGPRADDDPKLRILGAGGATISNSELQLAGKKILVVDDEADTRELLRLALSENGAEVVTAECVRDAIALLDEGLPDLLVSDIGMPEADGYSLIRHVKLLEMQQGRQIPAIALTGYAGDGDATRALEAGFQKHLSKPIHPQVLVAAVAALLAQK